VSSTLFLAQNVTNEVRNCSQQDPERECCGLLAGHNGVITRVIPGTNAAIDPATSYEIAIPELFQLMREIRAAGLELLGIYHSHPNGKNEPSPRDIAWAYYPDVAYFIISPLPGAPHPVRAFSIRDGSASELEIQIVPTERDDR
jgi:proteasome lid subunit RPN8/RPN11